MRFLFFLFFACQSLFAFEFNFEEDNSIPLVNISIATKPGAASDPKQLEGLTSFMGEMLLRGTQKKSKKDLELKLDELGSTASITTLKESLIIQGSVLSSQINSFLDLLEEIILTPSFDMSEIKKLKSQLISSLIAMREQDRSLAAIGFDTFLFENHPYGRRTFGTITSLKKITQNDLINHYKNFFSKENLIIVGTGDVQSQIVKNWVEKLSSKLPEKSLKIEIKKPDNPLQTKLLIIDKPDRTQNAIVIGHIGVNQTDPNYFPLYLANYAFGGGSTSSRLMKEIRLKRGWTYGVYSSFTFGTQPKDWSISLSTSTKDTSSAITEILKMINDLKQNGLTQDEFNYFKQAIINNSGFSYNTPEKRTQNALFEVLYGLPKGYYRGFSDKIRNLTLDDVNKSIKKFLNPESLAFTVVGSSKQLNTDLTKLSGIKFRQIKTKKYTEY